MNTTRLIGNALLVAIAVLIGAMVISYGRADASYRPAPERIVRAALRPTAPPSGTVARRAWIVCRYWRGHRCRPALNVAWCESTLRPWAANGQYLGIFQMGAVARRTYGHGSSTWAQARAAHRYWSASGWRPWQCRPYR